VSGNKEAGARTNLASIQQNIVGPVKSSAEEYNKFLNSTKATATATEIKKRGSDSEAGYRKLGAGKKKPSQGGGRNVQREKRGRETD
jgi:hypothetical protein